GCLHARLSWFVRVATRILILRHACFRRAVAPASHLLLATAASFFSAIASSEFRRVPKVGDVLVVLYHVESQAGAPHLLHRRADIFVEAFRAADDAGRFIGRGIIEALEGAGLAAVDAIERRPELDFGLWSDVVAGGAQTPEHLLAGGGILRQRGPGRSCK